MTPDQIRWCQELADKHNTLCAYLAVLVVMFSVAVAALWAKK